MDNGVGIDCEGVESGRTMGEKGGTTVTEQQ